MADQSCSLRKKSKQSISDDDEPSILPMKKQKTQNPTATILANSTSIVTKTLLDEANSGYKNGNFVCSPLSLDIIIGMLAVGAEGETLKQLLDFLGYKSIDKFFAKSPSSKLLKTELSNPRTGLECSLANGVWLDKEVEPVQSSYQNILKTVYKTEARSVDFRNKYVDEINSWVHKETKGLIPSIFERDSFDETSVMVIANALYFKGKWSNPIYANKTKPKDFNLINGEKISVPFMTSNKEFNYGSFEGYKLIKLPYKTYKAELNKFSMYIFLPHEKAGLKKLLQTFHSDDALFHGKFDLKSVKFAELWIPKFKMSCKFEAKDVMKQMGLTLPFEEMNNELSGIVEPDDAKLYVSEILQKSFIEVDERGTKAAACSVARGRTGGPARRYQPPTVTFVADHPFMFMIREDSSQAVLFVGVVLNPLHRS